MTERKISLTGIKPTGMPHIGNYFGAIKPALELGRKYESRYFIADYHALNVVKDPELLRRQTFEVAAVWLACGLNPENTLIYKQSSVPETFELTTMLMSFTSKGLMNRAHAYKAQVSENSSNGKDPDSGINMGLYTYPVLMAADILLFDPNYVPVGKDQKQHVEMTADIAQAVNHNYKKELFVIPEAIISETTKTIVGLDGKKMSKSYNNTIPLFIESKKLRKLVMKIVTTSQTLDEPKDPDKCNIFTLYKLFSTEQQQEKLREKYLAGGMGWGHAKQELFELMEAVLSPMRKEFDRLMEDKNYINKILERGAEKARTLAGEKLKFLRETMGID